MLPLSLRLPRVQLRTLGLLALVLFALLSGPGIVAPGSVRRAVAIEREGAAPKAYIGLFKDNAVAVFDTATRTVLRTIPVPAGPHGIVITPDGRTVFVSSDGDSVVSVIDTATDAVTSQIQVGSMPHGLAITRMGVFVLAAMLDQRGRVHRHGYG